MHCFLLSAYKQFAGRAVFGSLVKSLSEVVCEKAHVINKPVSSNFVIAFILIIYIYNMRLKEYK